MSFLGSKSSRQVSQQRQLTEGSLEPTSPGSLTSITSQLEAAYRLHVLPLEKEFLYPHFYSPCMTPGDFYANPMILLLGQYSTGKTTFVRHVLEKDYPGLRVGPEPTTEKFVAVCSTQLPNSGGPNNTLPQVLPGNAAVVDRNLPWSQLERFGPGFLSRFEVVHVKSSVFRGVTLIDSPGVLAGNKQWDRGYDFEGVIRWFGERVDLVFLFFDAHKLDISDEFRRCIHALRGNDSKICIILNKADSVSSQQLMRVYGALMWSLGKVMSIPEVPKIHIGTFWDQPLRNDEARSLFQAEAEDLMKLVFQLPARSAARKVDDFVKRVRLVRVHCLLLDYLRRQMPFLGKTSKQKDLLNNLPDIYRILANQYQLPVTDFPPVEDLRKSLAAIGEFHRFPKLESRKLRQMDLMLQEKIAPLTHLIPEEEAKYLIVSDIGSIAYTSSDSISSPTLRALLPDELLEMDLPPWAVSRYFLDPPDPGATFADFQRLGPNDSGLVAGYQARAFFEATRLPNHVLHRIWRLSDITNDGHLDSYEFALALRFMEMKRNNFELPPFTPPAYVTQYDESQLAAAARIFTAYKSQLPTCQAMSRFDNNSSIAYTVSKSLLQQPSSLNGTENLLDANTGTSGLDSMDAPLVRPLESSSPRSSPIFFSQGTEPDENSRSEPTLEMEECLKRQITPPLAQIEMRPKLSIGRYHSVDWPSTQAWVDRSFTQHVGIAPSCQSMLTASGDDYSEAEVGNLGPRISITLKDMKQEVVVSDNNDDECGYENAPTRPETAETEMFRNNNRCT